MEELTQKQQHAWKRRVTKEQLRILLQAGFDKQTDFYDIPVVGLMALHNFPYRDIRKVISAMYWGEREKGRSAEDIDFETYRDHPHLYFNPGERIEELMFCGCYLYPERFYDLTIQQLLSVVYYDPNYITEYSQYYVMFFERKGLDRLLCFLDRDDILNRYQRFSKR